MNIIIINPHNWISYVQNGKLDYILIDTSARQLFFKEYGRRLR